MEAITFQITRNDLISVIMVASVFAFLLYWGREAIDYWYWKKSLKHHVD